MVNKNNIAKKDFSNDLHKEIKKYITEKVVKFLNENKWKNRKELLKIIENYDGFNDNILKTIHGNIRNILWGNDKKEWDNNDDNNWISKKIIIELLYRFWQEEFINYLIKENKFGIKKYNTSKKIKTISSQLHSYFKSKKIKIKEFKEFYNKKHLKDYITKSKSMDLSDNIKIWIGNCTDKNVDKIIVWTFPWRKTLKSNSKNTSIYYCDPSNNFWKDYMFHFVDWKEDVKNIIASISYIDCLYNKLEYLQNSIQTLTLDLLWVDNDINYDGKRKKTFWRWRTYIKEYEIQLDFYENKILKEKELLGEMEKEFCETHEINFWDRVKVCFCDPHSSLDSSRIAIVYNDLSKYKYVFCNWWINDTSIWSVDYIRWLNSELLVKLKKEKVLTLNLNGTDTTMTILNSSSKTWENSRDIENWKTMLNLK